MPKPMPTIDKDLFEILRCPKCRGPLREAGDEAGGQDGLACPTCHLLYASVDGIPNMLIEEARSFSDEDPGSVRSPLA
jgi:uncharacterized protein YbaR (Trm112 family)